MTLQFTHVTHILVPPQWFSLIFTPFYIFSLVYASPPSFLIKFSWNFTTSLTTIISSMSLQFTHVTHILVPLQWFSLIFIAFYIFNLVYASPPSFFIRFSWNFTTLLSTIISWTSLHFTHVTHILFLLQWFFVNFYTVLDDI